MRGDPVALALGRYGSLHFSLYTEVTLERSQRPVDKGV